MKARWVKLPFVEAILDESGGNVKTPQSEFLTSGRFAVVDQGKNLVSGYVNTESSLCKASLPVIVFGDHTRCFKFVDFPFCMGADGVKVLRPKVEADVKYLFYYLRQLNLPDGGYDRHFKYLKRSHVLLPPLEEQRRIAEILDQAEEIRSKRREAIAELDTLTQAIFIEMFGDPVTNPKGWPSKALTDVCYCYSGGTPSKNNDAYWQGSLPWFSAKDLKFNDLFDSQDHINEDIPAKTTLKLLPENTVVIVVRGMILAHTFPISVLRIPATINQDLKALLPNEPLEPQLLAASLRSVAAFALQQVSEAAHGTKRLDAEGLRKIPIILPPLPLQQEFAHRVEAVEKLKAAHRASLSELDALFASLQHRAFRGEL